MSAIEAINMVISNLNQVEVKGTKNMSLILGSVQILEQILDYYRRMNEEQKKKEEEQTNVQDDAE